MKDMISEAQVMRAYHVAMNSMRRLNKNAALLMHKYKAHAATDVTGTFSPLGHLNTCATDHELMVCLSLGPWLVSRVWYSGAR